MQGEEGCEGVTVDLYAFPPQWRSGCKGRRGSVPVGLYSFASQVHKYPSQATHVHNLASTPLMIMMMINAPSVEDFGCVLSRKEPVLLY